MRRPSPASDGSAEHAFLAARSPRLKALVEQARGDYFVPADKLIYEEQIEASLDGHTRVVEAIQHADADAARSAMVDHIELTRTHIHRLIRGEPLHQPASRSSRVSPRLT